MSKDSGNQWKGAFCCQVPWTFLLLTRIYQHFNFAKTLKSIGSASGYIESMKKFKELEERKIKAEETRKMQIEEEKKEEVKKQQILREKI